MVMVETFEVNDSARPLQQQTSESVRSDFQNAASFRSVFSAENNRINASSSDSLPPLTIETAQPLPSAEPFNPAPEVSRTVRGLKEAEERSGENVARELRDTFSTLNSEQIKQVEAAYLQQTGNDLRADIRLNPGLSDSDKAVLSILLTGFETRSAADTQKLAQIAIDEHDLNSLGEVTRSLTPVERAGLLDALGADKLSQAFGSDGERALQVVLNGKLSTAQLVRDNTSWLTGDNEAAIELVLTNMTEEERRSYESGKTVFQTSGLDVSASQSADLAFYKDLNDALVGAGQPEEVAVWEGKILGTERSESDVRTLSERFEASDTPRELLEKLAAAVAEDPGLAVRLANPETREDRDAASTLRLYFPPEAMPLELQEVGAGSSLYDAAIKPILENGTVSLQLLAILNTTGSAVILGDVAHGSAEERGELLAPEQAASILRNFSAAEQQVILDVARQGEVKPANAIRFALVNDDLEAIKTVLGDLSKEELAVARSEYDTKYGDMDTQIHGLASSAQEEIEIAPLLTPPENLRERYNYERDAYYSSNEGLGRTIEELFGGTVGVSDQAHNLVSAAVESSGRSPESRFDSSELDRSFGYADDALQLFQDAKQHNADILTDGFIAAGTTASAILTVGAGAPLAGSILAGAGVGAATNVAGHRLFEGNDFEPNEIGSLLINGAVAGGTAAIGGAELGLFQNGATGVQRAIAEGTAGALGNGASSVTEGVVEGQDLTTVIENTFASSLVGFFGGSIASGAIDSGRQLFSDSRLRVTLEPAEVDEPVSVDTRRAENAQLGSSDSTSEAQLRATESAFPVRSEMERQISRELVESELKNVKASGDAGDSVLDRLEQSNLSENQKDRVLMVLSDVREHFLNFSESQGGFTVDPNQELNWIHTQGEMGRVLDAGAHNNLSPSDLEKSLIAAMLSDSDKHRSNFFTHHLDGARAAEVILPRYGFAPGDVQDVVQAVLEHQVGPPKFMSQMYQIRIVSSIDAERDAELKALRAIDPETRTAHEAQRFKQLNDEVNQWTSNKAEYEALRLERNRSTADEERMALLKTEIDYGAHLTPDEREALDSLTHKIGNPLGSRLEETADGRGKQLELREDEKNLLRRSGKRELVCSKSGLRRIDDFADFDRR